MGFLADITLMEWAIMIAVFGIIGAAYWLIDDSRRRGMHIGGKACGGCPHPPSRTYPSPTLPHQSSIPPSPLTALLLYPHQA